jgi:predicted ATP-grasp superfamily ATP-dependent carboligase
VVFVTDALLRKCVVVCHALSQCGVDVATGGTTRLSPGFFSRHGRRYLVYPTPEEQPERFIELLVTYLRRRSHEMVFPVDDATIAVCARFREDLERVTRLPLPSAEHLRYGLDKAPLMLLAEKLGIPHPKTVLPGDESTLLPLTEGLRMPLVVKPRASSAGRGIGYVSTRQDLASTWAEAHRSYPRPMVQECVPNGRKFGVGLLMDHNGRCVASFVQEELRHFPLRDGMSTLQVSVLRPDLVERAVSLLQTIGWYGLAEVEFMEHPETGEMLLLEVNPRIWASIQLAVACGVNFPYLLYQLTTGRPFEEVHTYVVGRQCRWLVPGDILHFVANADRMRMHPSFFEFSRRETVYDGLYRDDLGATFGVFVSSAHYLLDSEMWRMLLRGRPSLGQHSGTVAST